MLEHELEAERSRWDKHSVNTKIRTKASKIAEIALKAFEKEGRDSTATHRMKVADIGAGSGRDSVTYLLKGWLVLAIDLSAKGFEFLRSKIRPEDHAQLTTEITRFQDMTLTPNSLDLVSSALSLSFVPKSDFRSIWQKLLHATKDNGRLSVEFFGNNHAWANSNDSYFTRSEISDLLNHSRLKLENIQEEDDPNTSLAAGGSTRFHLFRVLAKKVAVYVERPIADEEMVDAHAATI